jgi:type 2 lantibiotic biosynthesis protein LanM
MDNAPWPRYALVEPTTSVDRQRLHAAACAIGDRLESLALRGENDVSWIGLKVEQDRYWSLAPLGIELYDGLAGVTLFLAYLGAITGEQRYTTLAQSSLTTLRRQIERSQSYLTSIGGFSGWGGIIYLLAHLGALWEQPELFVEAEAIVAGLPDAITHDEYLDVIGGAAGCIASLLSLYHCKPSRQTLEVAIQCGNRLVDRAQTMQDGSGWSTSISQQPLAGFSHGAAGMAWALLRLVAITGETRFREVAIDAMRYERSLFVPEVGNWPDLRTFEELQPTQIEGQPRFMSAWCHGAPGIGLARLEVLRELDDPAILLEIEAALQTTLAGGFGRNHSLCHGDLGNLELLLSAGEALDTPYWRSQTQRLSAVILESIGRDGWLCGAPLGVESPGLMTGLAGIGYQLLRLADPQRVPSILVLTPPQPRM